MNLKLFLGTPNTMRRQRRSRKPSNVSNEQNYMCSFPPSASGNGGGSVGSMEQRPIPQRIFSKVSANFTTCNILIFIIQSNKLKKSF